MKKLFLIILLFNTFIYNTYSIYQINYDSISKYEDTLKFLSKQILSTDIKTDKYIINDKFSKLLKKTIEIENSFNYPFDSLRKTVAILKSPDNAFRIYNWNIPGQDGTFEYFGFIQVYNLKSKISNIITLTDKSSDIKNPEQQILSPENWFGALYYKIILEKYKGNKYYTLLGWDGNNLISKKKIIDVITFDLQNNLFFGAPIFQVDTTYAKRVIFEYSAQAVMSLKYEEQYYRVDVNKKNINKKPPKLKKGILIVFDHLVPTDPQLKNEYQYYVPVIDILNGYIFKQGKWNFIKEVEARNSIETEKKHPKKKTIKYNLSPSNK